LDIVLKKIENIHLYYRIIL